MGKVIIWVSLLLIVLSVTGCVDSENGDNINGSVIDNVTISASGENDTIKDIADSTNEHIISEGIKDDSNISVTDNVTISVSGENDTIKDITYVTNETTISGGIKDDTNDMVKDTGFLSETFKVNDQKKMFDKNIKLLELETEEGTAIIGVDGEPYRFIYNTERQIDSRIIKIIDLNGMDQTVKVMIK